MSKNTIVRGCLVPSLKNKPLDGRQDVPTLADIANIENPYVNFIFPVKETGKWYKVVSLKDKVINELIIPNGEVDEYEIFGGGMTDKEKEEYLTKQLAEITYLKKDDAEEMYQPKGEYATKQELQTYSKSEVSIGTAEPTGKDVKLWVDTSYKPSGGGSDNGGDGDSTAKQYETLNLIVSAENGSAITAIVNVNGKDVAVTSTSSYSEKFEYGTEYTITPQAVEGYAAPEPLTFVAGQEIRTVNLKYEHIIKTTIVQINQNIADPEMMVTRIVDNGGIEAIRANSHRYIGTLADGTMCLKQLKDTNSEVYVDGTFASENITNDVFMKLPNFFYKAEEIDANIWNVGFAYGAKPDDTWKEWNGKLMYGAYRTTYGGFNSLSGKSLTNSTTSDKISMDELRANLVSQKGANYGFMSLRDMNMMYFLFLTYYGKVDTSFLGSDKITITGVSNAFGMTDTDGNTEFSNFWGLENYIYGMFCYTETIRDGIVSTREELNLGIEAKDFPAIVTNSTNYVLKRIIGDDLNIFPSELGGTYSTGYCASYKNENYDYSILVNISGGHKIGSYITSSDEFSHTPYFRLVYCGDYIIEQ